MSALRPKKSQHNTTRNITPVTSIVSSLIKDIHLKEWLKNTEFETLLKSSIDLLDDDTLRTFLFRYCESYHEIYPFEMLEDVFDYLRSTIIIDKSPDLLPMLPEIKAAVADATHEYGFSLCEVAEAVNRFLDNNPITFSCAMELLNHIIEAHSCNESPEIFFNREERYLFNEIKKYNC